MEQSNKMQTAADIWLKYQQGQEYGRLSGRFTDSEKCWRFFEGDQWGGLTDDGAPLPMYNIIRPVINYKKAKIAMNAKTITFSMEGKDQKGILETVNRQIREAWEFGKMDAKCWEIVKQGLVSGHSVLFFPDGAFFDQSAGEICRCNDRRVFAQILDGCQVFFGNELEGELQNQPYIILQERLLTDQIKKIAEKNGLSEQEVGKILPDEREDSDITTGQKNEPDGKQRFTTSLIYFERAEGGVRFCRATKDVIYQPFKDLKTDYYPMVDYAVNRQKGKARGIGEVKHMIPNQIELNRTLVRRSAAIKQAAYPKVIYNSAMISDISNLTKPGAAIAVDDAMQVGDVQRMVGYLQPAASGNEASGFMSELISITKELAGAGDAALGNINPEQASGAAITAVQDQADIPMNEEISAYAQMIEDIAVVWYHMILAFNSTGYKTDKDLKVTAEEMKKICPKIKVDVSSTIPDTVTARLNTLYGFLQMQAISFDEFLELAPAESNLPTEEIKRLRKEAQEQQNKMMNAKAAAIDQELQAAELEQMMSGQGGNAFAGMMGG